jgi:hypothetical protein
VYVCFLIPIDVWVCSSAESKGRVAAKVQREREKERKKAKPLWAADPSQMSVQFVRMGVVGGLMMTSVWGTRREHNSEELLLLIKGTGDQSVC